MKQLTIDGIVVCELPDDKAEQLVSTVKAVGKPGSLEVFNCAVSKSAWCQIRSSNVQERRAQCMYSLGLMFEVVQKKL